MTVVTVVTGRKLILTPELLALVLGYLEFGYQELYADPTKHFTDEELKERDANIKPGEEVGGASRVTTVHRGIVEAYLSREKCAQAKAKTL